MRRQRHHRINQRDLSDLKYREANAQEILDRLAGIVKNGARESAEEINNSKQKKKRGGSDSSGDNQFIRYRKISDNIVLFSQPWKKLKKHRHRQYNKGVTPNNFDLSDSGSGSGNGSQDANGSRFRKKGLKLGNGSLLQTETSDEERNKNRAQGGVTLQDLHKIKKKK